jgi:hypothetical protein
MTIGVYAIIHKKSRKVYIGSSANVERRLTIHKSYIKTQSQFVPVGIKEDGVFDVEEFEFKILRATDSLDAARELETAALECFCGDNLYNKAPHADGSTGTKRDSAAYVVGAQKRLADNGFRKRLSDACKGKREVVTCPHCGLSGGGGNMRRYHFDNCKK